MELLRKKKMEMVILDRTETKIIVVKEENEKKKEYLRQYQKHARRISRIDAEIKEIRMLKLSPALRMGDGMPKGSNQNDLSDFAANIGLMEEELYKEGIELVKSYNRILYRIKQLPDKNESDVLFYRYIKDMKFWEISKTMGYSERHITRLHGDALSHLELPKDVLECPSNL